MVMTGVTGACGAREYLPLAAITCGPPAQDMGQGAQGIPLENPHALVFGQDTGEGAGLPKVGWPLGSVVHD